MGRSDQRYERKLSKNVVRTQNRCEALVKRDDTQMAFSRHYIERPRTTTGKSKVILVQLSFGSESPDQEEEEIHSSRTKTEDE